MFKYGVFSGPYFPAFGLNTERYEVSLRIQSECGKIRTGKYSVFGHFSHSVNLKLFQKITWKLESYSSFFIALFVAFENKNREGDGQPRASVQLALPPWDNPYTTIVDFMCLDTILKYGNSQHNYIKFRWKNIISSNFQAWKPNATHCSNSQIMQH